MEFFEMSLAIILVIVTWIGAIATIKWIWTLLKHWFGYMVERREPISQDNQELVDIATEQVRPEREEEEEEKMGDLSDSPDQRNDGTTSAAAPVASSSSLSSAVEWKYDVFLSFRGPDTRKRITVDIQDRLNRRGIKTVMDDRDLEVGNVISPALLTAIRESKFAIVVLSQNYAFSTWCLEELREICLCMEDNRILPLFYHVDPTDVRFQKRSFEEAFSKHETSGRHESEKVKQWKAALNKVANISGWNTNDYKTHKELVDVIAESLRSKVPPDAIESTGDFQAYEATTQAMNEVMKALTDNEISAVGVYGMGGVGKTSMVRHVAAKACKNGTFNRWIIVAISQSHDFGKIQGTLADFLGVKLDKETEDGRAAALHKEIMRRGRLLIILDDVWNRIELSAIGIPSYEELQKCNSKVVLTTRRRNVCHVMKCQASIPLNILSEQDSWTLFLRNAVINPFQSTTFENVAMRVAVECKGLPIALIAVARALGDEDLGEWEKAAELLEQSRCANPNHEDENAFNCIRLSYDYLKSEDRKSCFLLCCLYPEDHEIEMEDLFRYAIGKGLFQDAETLVKARGTVVSVVKYLKDSSLLLDGEKNGCVKMHDVIRDTAIQIAKSEDGHRFLVKAGCGLENWRPRGLHEGCTAISLMRNEIRKLPEEELVCPNLQILLLNRNADLDEIPEKSIQKLNELRLLDLSDTSISVLPQSFSLLTNLQALYLDSPKKFIDISIVGKLKLEILSMRECPGSGGLSRFGHEHPERRELSREIGHLTNLRILDVNRSWARASVSGVVTIPSKVISKLHKLEELYMVYCGFEETNIFDELAGLSNLKIVQVGISDAKYIPKNVEAKPDWDYFYISIIGGRNSAAYRSGDHNSRSLYLTEATTISTLPDWFINAVTKKTETLEYDCCKGMSDILMEYDHERLHKLKHLRVCGYFLDSYVYMTELMNTTRRVQKGPVFENLEELHLVDLIHLEELCVGELPPGSLSNLKVLHMFCCLILKNVSKFVQRLPNLEKLDLNWMDKLEYVFGCEGFEPKQSKLREMHLLGPNSVKSICSGPAPRVMFQSLKSLTFYSCNMMESLFTSDVAQCLFQLEDLYVEQCRSLKRVIEAVNKKKTVLPKLKNLVLKKLPMLYCTRTCYGARATVDIECPSLEQLIVVDCSQFPFSTSSSLFQAFESRNQFSFSTSASDYFGSTNPVKLNDPQLYDFLHDRTEGAWQDGESELSTVRPIETEFTMPMGDFQAFEATRQAMDEVKKALEADDVTAIGVYGMGGVGKTTMVEHVSAEVQDNGIFHHVISAVVSQNPDLRKIQGTLAEMLGFIFEEETEIGRARRLMQRIRRGNRILIILDDIRERIDLSNIGIPSYHELQRCNSKVLLTTRIQNVCCTMKCQSIISLDVLSEKDSMTLFVNKARISFASTDSCDVAKKIARACAGLPVALIAVAKALADKGSDDWNKAAQRLEASQPANLEYWEVVFNCIKLSYDYLDTDDARSCFLLCCLFPEDYDIQIEDLLKYGMGKGLFQESRTMQDARVTAHLVVKYLKDCSLLLETEQDGCVKMHDVIRDVARRISTSEFFVQAGCQLKEWPSISAHEGYSAISLIRNKICKLPEKLVCPKLHILFLQSNVWLNVIPDHFFQSLNVLRVLDISRTRISFLPTSFGILINLQTLYLDGCLSTIDNISILGKLKKLEILSMRELPLVELPKEIRDLSNLRMLDITGDYVDNVPSEVICNLNLLEELYMQCNFADWGSKVEGAGEENIVAFDELTGLSNLNVLKVFISDAKCLPRDVEVEPNWVNFDICIGRDPSIRKVSLVSSSSPAFIRALTLDTTINALPGWFINAVTMKAEKLQYIMCWGLANILVEYDCGRLHALKYLSVIGPNEKLEVLMNTVTPFRNEPVFQNLEELHLVQVDCLKELCVGELPLGSLCNLRLLKVKHCYELVGALLPSRLLQRLQNLEELICEEIDELKYVFGCEGLEPKQVILTQLIEMRLENLGKLIKIWNGPAHCAVFQNLQCLIVSRCFELENLFTADVAQCILHLEDLSVELCPMLDHIIEASKDTVDNKIVFPKLKILTLIKLPQLTRFCGSTGSAIECPLLEYLYVERCPQFPMPDFHIRDNVQRNHPQHLDIVQRRAQSREKKKNQFTEVSREDGVLPAEDRI